MCAFLKLHHNCDAYTDVQKEQKSSLHFSAFKHREKEPRSLFAEQYRYRICLQGGDYPSPQKPMKVTLFTMILSGLSQMQLQKSLEQYQKIPKICAA